MQDFMVFIFSFLEYTKITYWSNCISERIEELEDQIDILKARAIQEAVKRRDIEIFPAEVVHQLIDGISPVKVYRKHRKLTSQELANKVGVTQAFISQLETGKKKGSLETLKKIADTLDLTVDDLIWDHD